MDEAAIRDKYLDLLSISWDLPELVKPLEELRKQANEGGLDTWVRLIDARLLRNAKRNDEALRHLDAILETTADEPHALFLKAGVVSEDPDRRQEAILMWDRLVTLLSPKPDFRSRQIVAMALVNKSVVLCEMNKPQDAIAPCDEVMRRFGECPETPLREQVARALVSKGIALGQVNEPQEACPTYDEVIRRFGECPGTPMRETVALALFNKAATLDRMVRPQDAIAAYDELIRRFGEGESKWLRDLACIAQALKALVTKESAPAQEAQEAEDAALLGAEGKYSETLRLYLGLLLGDFQRNTIDDYFRKIAERKKRTDEFLTAASRFREDASVLVVLREWNSYTPAIPAEEEADRGGGYFIRHAGVGIVVDPGYDFIQNFHRAGGVLGDIDHIILTHAHDDHTAELEAILMLLHQKGQYVDKSANPARVRLYLSEGAQRKFAGLIALKDDPQIISVTTLSRQEAGSLQRVKLSDQITLTVLRAYHDDVLTRDTAVGLGFEFALPGGGLRRVVFTGDSGYYPRKLDASGSQEYYDLREKEHPKVDCREETGLIEQYPKEFRQPDLLVAHIGSIKEDEFKPLDTSRMIPEPDRRLREEGEWYYVNHLGLLGTLTLLDKSWPRSAIISEFGAELRDFNIELVVKLGESLNKKQRKDSSDSQVQQTFVIPGDITIVYDITGDQFLCHQDGQMHPSKDLECIRHHTFDVQGQDRNLAPAVKPCYTTRRAYLCLRGSTTADLHNGIDRYHRDLFAWRLPHLKGAQ